MNIPGPLRLWWLDGAGVAHHPLQLAPRGTQAPSSALRRTNVHPDRSHAVVPVPCRTGWSTRTGWPEPKTRDMYPWPISRRGDTAPTFVSCHHRAHLGRALIHIPIGAGAIGRKSGPRGRSFAGGCRRHRDRVCHRLPVSRLHPARHYRRCRDALLLPPRLPSIPSRSGRAGPLIQGRTRRIPPPGPPISEV